MSSIYKNGVEQYDFDGELVENPFSKDEEFIPQSGGGFVGGETKWQSADDIRQRIENLESCIALARKHPEKPGVTEYEKEISRLEKQLLVGEKAFYKTQTVFIDDDLVIVQGDLVIARDEVSTIKEEQALTEAIEEKEAAKQKQIKREQAAHMNAERKRRAEEEGGQSAVLIKRNKRIYDLYLDYPEPRNKTKIAGDIAELHDDDVILADAAIDLGKPIGSDGITKVITKFQKIDKRG